GRQKTVQGGLATAARVALELRVVADEDPPGDAGGHLPAEVVIDADLGPQRGAPRGARRLPEILGRGDRGPGRLGRAVEVVDDVAELVHEALGQLAREGRTGEGDHLERGGVVLAAGAAGAVQSPRGAPRA